MITIKALEEKYAGEHIAIIGNGPSAFAVDFSEYSRPLWVVNGGWTLHPTADLCFMMDDIHGPVLKEMGGDYQERLEEIRDCPIPIITSTSYPDYPSLLDYPIIRVLEHFNMRQPYFGETTNYMVAWAIMLGVKAIDFFGIDFINCRPDERASLEFWAGVAKGRGIRLFSSPASHFLRTQETNGLARHVPDLYGYLPHNVPFLYRDQPNGTIAAI